MTKLFLSIGYYLAALFLIRHIHAWSPTNLAGPGLDLVVYALVPIIGIALLARSLKQRTPGDGKSNVMAAIHAAGLLLIIIAVYIGRT